VLLLAVLTLVCVVTYTFEIVFGLAGTIMMVTAMSLVYDTKTLVIYSILPQILVGGIGLLRSPRTVELRYLAGMLGFAVIGGAVGLYLFYATSVELFRVLLALTIVTFGAYLVFGPSRLSLRPWMMRVMDTIAGASQALFGISGPIAMTRLLGSFEDKTRIRNYALAFFLSLNVLRAAGYLVNGTITSEIATMMAFTAPWLVLTLWFSNHLHFRVNETWFRKVVAWVILLGGISLLLH
jgi:uncharacterized membrane protein YfcA